MVNFREVPYGQIFATFVAARSGTVNFEWIFLNASATVSITLKTFLRWKFEVYRTTLKIRYLKLFSCWTTIFIFVAYDHRRSTWSLSKKKCQCLKNACSFFFFFFYILVSNRKNGSLFCTHAKKWNSLFFDIARFLAVFFRILQCVSL